MKPQIGDKIIFINCNAKEHETIIYKYYTENEPMKLNITDEQALYLSKKYNIEIKKL
jgi:hypothetical protein